jgi:hypothetical protein
VEINKNISKTEPIFKGKSKETEGFTPTSDKYTHKMIVLHPYSRYFTHKAVRIDVRVKISWHPHPAYPPLSTLKAGLFAFTRTLRGIDPY